MASSPIWGGLGAYHNPVSPGPRGQRRAAPVRSAPIWGGRGTYTNPAVAQPNLGRLQKVSSPAQPGLAPVKPAATPAAPTAATPATPGTAATQPSPYDSTYYIDLAQATARANSNIIGYQANIANGQTNLNSTLQQLKYNQGLATTHAQNAENARGGFAQGALGNTIGQLNRSYLDTSSADTLKYQQDSASWNSAISSARQGLSIEQIALGLASGDRQAKLNAASDGTISGTPGDPGTPAGTTAAPDPGAVARWNAALARGSTPAGNRANKTIAPLGMPRSNLGVLHKQAGLGQLGGRLRKQR